MPPQMPCKLWSKPMSLALVAAAVAVGPALVAQADEVKLTTGETLEGTVVEQNETDVVLQHPILGELTVPRNNVANVTIDQQDEQQEGQQAAPNDSGQTDQSAQEAKQEDNTETSQTAEAKADQADEGAAPEQREDFDFFAGWDLQASLGFVGTEGNSQTQSFNAQFKATKENKRHRWLFDNKYFFGSSDGETTQNEFNSTLTKDWLKPDSPWFYFAKGIYDYDQFEAWDHRVSGFGGVGYNFVDREDLAVAGRLGVGLTKEFGDQADDLRPEALIGLDLIRWHITDNQNLTAGTTLYPDLSDFPESRIVSNIEWTVDIDQADGLKLKLGAEHEYESETVGDTKHNDLKYYGALAYDF